MNSHLQSSVPWETVEVAGAVVTTLLELLQPFSLLLLLTTLLFSSEPLLTEELFLDSTFELTFLPPNKIKQHYFY